MRRNILDIRMYCGECKKECDLDDDDDRITCKKCKKYITGEELNMV